MGEATIIKELTSFSAIAGKEHLLKSVFVHTLRYVMQEALKEVSRAVPDMIKTEQVHWVLTIPAIWKVCVVTELRQTPCLALLTNLRVCSPTRRHAHQLNDCFLPPGWRKVIHAHLRS